VASQLKRLSDVIVQDVSGTGSGGISFVTGVDCSTTGDTRFIEAYIIAQLNATPTSVAAQIVRAQVKCDATTPVILATNSATKLGTTPSGAFSLNVSGTKVRAQLVNDAAVDLKMQVVFYIYG